ncbi:hypothetical protein LP420_35495 [Massilia sp. B-10]|nr:hypothetical protein LP420_35495 [Massilia sp. B-10]
MRGATSVMNPADGSATDKLGLSRQGPGRGSGHPHHRAARLEQQFVAVAHEARFRTGVHRRRRRHRGARRVHPARPGMVELLRAQFLADHRRRRGLVEGALHGAGRQRRQRDPERDSADRIAGDRRRPPAGHGSAACACAIWAPTRWKKPACRSRPRSLPPT